MATASDFSKFWSPAFDTMDDFVFIIDSDFNVIDVNKAFLDFTKTKKSELIGKKCYELVHGSQAFATLCPHKKMLETGQFETSEFYDERLKKWLYVRVTPIFDDEKNLIGSIHMAADVTERRAADEKIRESERKMRAVLDQTFQFIGLMTIDGTLIEANRSAVGLIGVQLSDILNKPFWQTPWWSHSVELQNRLREAIKKAASGEFVRLEVTHPAKDGTLHFIDFSLKPIKDNKGNITFLIPEGRDITHIRKIENGIDRLAAIVESSDDAIVGKTTDGKITSWNKGAEKIYGYTADEMIGRHISLLVPPERADELEHIYEKIKNGEHVEHFETIRVRKDGSRILISLTISPIRDRIGHVVGASAIARDITSLKNTEEELKKRVSELERFQRITVDRELKMKELKAHILELEAKLKQ